MEEKFPKLALMMTFLYFSNYFFFGDAEAQAVITVWCEVEQVD
jgi:hypothetical protein